MEDAKKKQLDEAEKTCHWQVIGGASHHGHVPSKTKTQHVFSFFPIPTMIQRECLGSRVVSQSESGYSA
jgi:hypothetical protein